MHTAKIGLLVALLVSLAGGVAEALVMQTVTVGDTGNAPYVGSYHSYGAVAYTYNIGKYEVTAGQYCDFLNAVARTDTYGLYSVYMDETLYPQSYGCNIKRGGSSGSYIYSVASDWANRPVNRVSWGSSVRFVNWLYNGQPTGDQGLTTTEDGSYYLNGATSDADLMAVTRKANATWAIPTEDEWYKAAYYTGGSKNAGYWKYPTRSNATPGRDLADPSGNNANYCSGSGAYPIDSGTYYTTVVGQFGNSASPYGTFDQGGNVWEWTEGVHTQYGVGSWRVSRGGSFVLNNVCEIGQEYSLWNNPSSPSLMLGFRVAQVPEPATLALLALGAVGVLMRRKLK